MVLYSAKGQGFDEDILKIIYLPGDSQYKEKVVKNEQDLLQFKNRIIIIVSFICVSHKYIAGKISRVARNIGHDT